MNRNDKVIELKQSVGCILWKSVGHIFPPWLLTTSPHIAGTVRTAGRKGDLGFVHAGTGWRKAFRDWMWAAKPLSKALEGPDRARNCVAVYSCTLPVQTVSSTISSICWTGEQLRWKRQSTWRTISAQFLKLKLEYCWPVKGSGDSSVILNSSSFSYAILSPAEVLWN